MNCLKIASAIQNNHAKADFKRMKINHCNQNYYNWSTFKEITLQGTYWPCDSSNPIETQSTNYCRHYSTVIRPIITNRDTPSLPSGRLNLASSQGVMMSNWMGASGKKVPSDGVDGGMLGWLDRPKLDASLENAINTRVDKIDNFPHYIETAKNFCTLD